MTGAESLLVLLLTMKCIEASNVYCKGNLQRLIDMVINLV